MDLRDSAHRLAVSAWRLEFEKSPELQKRAYEQEWSSLITWQPVSALDMQPATVKVREHVKLQGKYLTLLNLLYRGYSKGFPDGGEDIKQARATMVSRAGIDDIADKISERKLLVSFDPIQDPRFGSIGPP